MFPPVGGTMIGLGVVGWLILHRWKQVKAEEAEQNMDNEPERKA